MEAPYQVPHVLIHFDINGTLTLKDSTKTAKDGKQVSNEYMILSALAESTVAVWNPNYPKMPFKDYVYNILVPGDKSNTQIKEQRQAIISNFIPWLRENHHPALFKVQYEYQQLIRTFTDIYTNTLELEIFNSFYTLIQKLNELKIPHTIILRTFGSDLDTTVREIENNERIPGIRFSTKINLKDATLTDQNVHALFMNFLSSTHYMAVHDDWVKWSQDEERGRSGKPFIYNSLDRKTLSIFFDDKITGEEKDIINPVDISGSKATTKDLKGRMLFPVNTTKAALDEEYYIRKVLKALAISG